MFSILMTSLNDKPLILYEKTPKRDIIEIPQLDEISIILNNFKPYRIFVIQRGNTTTTPRLFRVLIVTKYFIDKNHSCQID